MRNWIAVMLVAVASIGQAQDRSTSGDAPVVPPISMCGGDGAVTANPLLLDGYGSGGFAVATRVPAAQAFFDNGMQLGAAFAHGAAISAFKEAVRLDPDCAMCLWGEAWASGPTINYPVSRRESDRLAKLVQRASLLAAKGPPREQALIAALRLRYAPGKAARANLAYAKAMDALTVAAPEDKALATLAADAWLVAAGDSKAPQAAVDRSIALLQDVLRRDPDYTPAIHFYIHATEFAGVPARATPYADRLARLAPKASHLVHMPSHTYYWIGRYQDAAEANARAVAIGIEDARRQGMKAPDGVWDLPYHAHNVHFGVGGALMSGDARIALALSDPLVAVAAKRDKDGVFPQLMTAMGYAAEGRFADPAAVLALPEPRLAFVKAYWRYGRGEAQARLGNAAAVRAEAMLIPWTIRGTANDDRKLVVVAVRMARIARLVLLGRAAMLEGKPDEALTAFRQAAAYQEEKRVMQFSDPPIWWYPVRRSIAEALIAKGDAAAALAEADAVLKLRPADPMTMAVRAKAEAALGRSAAARRDRNIAMRSWRGDRAAFAAASI